MSTVERVKKICKERRIPISKLEKSCGFANGYIGQLRKGSIPADRLAKIAAYLEMDINDFIDIPNEAAQAPADLSEDEAQLLRIFRKLNAAGKKRALEYLEDLSQVPRYSGKNGESSISNAG